MKTFIYCMDDDYDEYVGCVVAESEEEAEKLIRGAWLSHYAAKYADPPRLVRELPPGEAFIGG